MKVLLFDGMNFLHRARKGFEVGPAPLLFNTLRNLRSTVSKFPHDEIYFVMEGNPKFRKELLPEYKANRVLKSEKEKSLAKDFYQQIDETLKAILLLGVKVIRHPKYECDDTIACLAKYHSELGDDVTIFSNDTDFIQLLSHLEPKISLYNLQKKCFVEPVPYDYVVWKALKGDPSDNIDGFKGIGNVRATSLVTNPDALEAFLKAHDSESKFQRNVSLIKLASVSRDELEAFEGSFDELGLRVIFEKNGFISLLKKFESFVSSFTVKANN